MKMQVQKTCHQVTFYCHHSYCVRIETLQCKHRSIEFLTTQTDQSKSNIFIDYVLIFSFPPSFEYALNSVKYLSFAIL